MWEIMAVAHSRVSVCTPSSRRPTRRRPRTPSRPSPSSPRAPTRLAPTRRRWQSGTACATASPAIGASWTWTWCFALLGPFLPLRWRRHRTGTSAVWVQPASTTSWTTPRASCQSPLCSPRTSQSLTTPTRTTPTWPRLRMLPGRTPRACPWACRSWRRHFGRNSASEPCSRYSSACPSTRRAACTHASSPCRGALPTWAPSLSW
mmetsp:Transcript_31264/g.70325  ORF Transcript_31264/g.70325 Transcript_31264/m.70325 type:complete len:205 (+) Transcript_31264:604-1218(+)